MIKVLLATGPWTAVGLAPWPAVLVVSLLKIWGYRWIAGVFATVIHANRQQLFRRRVGTGLLVDVFYIGLLLVLRPQTGLAPFYLILLAVRLIEWIVLLWSSADKTVRSQLTGLLLLQGIAATFLAGALELPFLVFLVSVLDVATVRDLCSLLY